MTHIYLVRHGQTDWNAAGRLQGAVDIELNDTGRRQAQIIADELVGIVPDAVHVVVSPLVRAHDTGRAIAHTLGVELSVDARFMERSFGQWEGTTHAERIESDPLEVERWASGSEPNIAGYEAQAALQERMAASIADAAQDAAGPVVVVSHGSALRAGIGAITGIPTTPGQQFSILGGIGNAHWARVIKQVHTWTLDAYNIAPRGWVA